MTKKGLSSQEIEDLVSPEKKIERFLVKNNPIPFLLEAAGKIHVGDQEILLAHFLSGHSLGLDGVDPLSLYTVGASSRGKSHVAGTVFDFFPNKNTLRLASFSPKAFYYAQSDSEKNFSQMIVHTPELVLDPRDEDKAAMLRLLTDSGSNRKPVHFTLGPKRDLLKLELKGKTLLWFNSVSAVSDDQLKNRLLLLNPNESREQDQAVFNFQIQTVGLGLKQLSDDEKEFLCSVNEKIFNAPPCVVLVPFADYISFPVLGNRRLLPLFLSLIKAAARMNQKRRLTAGGIHVLAEPEDFIVAVAVWDVAIRLTASQVSRAALELLERIPFGRDTAVDKNKAAEIVGISSITAYGYLKSLSDAGFLNQERLGSSNIYWRPLGNLITNSLKRPILDLNGFLSQTDAFYEARYRKMGSVAPLEEAKSYLAKCYLPQNSLMSFTEWLELAIKPEKQENSSLSRATNEVVRAIPPTTLTNPPDLKTCIRKDCFKPSVVVGPDGYCY
ncbi:MAG: hypothetical protein J4215_02830, partial [Candidatus Diapherotrites archaeon]|nr:hypothetical protein [Candidatus Diapherotrites archaeon]